MKNVFFYAVLIFIMASCSDSASDDASDDGDKKSAEKEIPAGKDSEGMDIEYYPGTTVVKAKGRLDAEGKRHGIWRGFDKNTGICQSQTDYNHGQKNGVSMVYFANGAIRYTGEYRNDIQVGKWIYYDEKGTQKIVDYDEVATK